MRFKSRIYVPQTKEECIKVLRRLMPEANVSCLRSKPYKQLLALYFSLRDIKQEKKEEEIKRAKELRCSRKFPTAWW